MPTLVHITDERNVSAIQRAGIRPSKLRPVVYFMPVTQNHLISHQWMRELRPSGAKVLVGVYFQLPSEELVWAGRYNEPHKAMQLGAAIALLNNQSDQLGFEIFIERKILSNEISRIRHFQKAIGWRYQPNAHGKKPCPCPACLPSGEIKSKRIRIRDEPAFKPPSFLEVLAQFRQANESFDILDWLWPLRTKRRIADPSFLEPYLASNDSYILEELALTLPYFRHPSSTQMLLRLESHADPIIRETAEAGLLALSTGRKPKSR